jgi:oligopeptide/dipeptide ABC transporter ATP-binding protein
MEKAGLLAVHHLVTGFSSQRRMARAVDGVSFEIGPAESLGIVGESGCGKTVTALSLMRLIRPPGKILGGRVILEGVDLLQLGDEEMRRVRGARMAMIFQNPLTSLDPVFTIGKQITEGLMAHRKADRSRAREKALEMLKMVGIPDPQRRIDEYPHSLSGGMRQRAMIAMALVRQPRLLIADEPTTALDATVQLQVMSLIKKLQASFQMALILITHDLGMVASFVSRVAVMYCGQVVEESPVRELLNGPLHPYTRGLIESKPTLGTRSRRLNAIGGSVPDIRQLAGGCRFAPRCRQATERCRESLPSLQAHGAERKVRCWHPVLSAEHPQHVYR